MARLLTALGLLLAALPAASAPPPPPVEAAPRLQVPLAIGFSIPRGVHRRQTDNHWFAFEAGAGLEYWITPKVAVADQLQATLGQAHGIANRLGATRRLPWVDLGADLGLHWQRNVSRTGDPCGNRSGPSRTDCTASPRLVKHFEDQSAFLSLGARMDMRIGSGKALRLQAGYPAWILYRDSHGSQDWLHGWDTGTPSVTPALDNAERRGPVLACTFMMRL